MSRLLARKIAALTRPRRDEADPIGDDERAIVAQMREDFKHKYGRTPGTRRRS